MEHEQEVARWALRLVGPEATEALGEALGRLAAAGDVVALHGDLGAGKTTFVRGLARGLGAPDEVASPTYTLMDTLEGGRLPLFHFDAWMEGREKALFLDGGDEWLRAGGIAVIEWAARVAEWLPVPRWEVTLEHQSLEERRAVVQVVEAAPGPFRARLQALRSAWTTPGRTPAPRDRDTPDPGGSDVLGPE
jgi:tRNA threonylcarbamoyladenosine biosynthesis protein TsaE